MLSLSRKVGESVHIGDEITLTITAIRAKQVRVVVEAPSDISIRRDDIVNRHPVKTQSPLKMKKKIG